MQPAGWYEDPEDPRRLRWWTGKQWSKRWMDRPGVAAAEDPAPATAAGSVQAPPPFPSSGPASPSTPYPPFSAATAGSAPAPPRSFPEAVRVCFQKYAVFKGRASRSEYWFWTLFYFLVALVQLAVFETIYATTISETVFGLSALLDFGIALALVLPSLAVSVRRLHDIGKSGWNLLWILIPIGGAIALFIWSIHPGEPRTNAYG